MTIKKTGISVHCKSMFLVVDSMCDDLSTLLKELEVVFFRHEQWLETIIFATMDKQLLYYPHNNNKT